MAGDVLVGLEVAVEGVAGWLSSWNGGDSPHAISRGLFAGEVGVPRLLKLFERLDVRATWFLPGHSIETFPRQMRQVIEAGHEIAAHGYSHEHPRLMTPEQEERVLVRSIELIEQLSGRRPAGYCAPNWDVSAVTVDLLLKHGFTYDHSLMHHDAQPYYVRTGDTWTRLDYSKSADEWMKPLVRGTETSLVEIPVHWHLADIPPLMFIKGSPTSQGFVPTREVEHLWREHFDWIAREYDYAVFTLSLHPDVIATPHALPMLERFIRGVRELPDARFATFEEIAADFASRRPPSGPGAYGGAGRAGT